MKNLFASLLILLSFSSCMKPKSVMYAVDDAEVSAIANQQEELKGHKSKG